MSRHEQNVSLCRGVLRWSVVVCAAVHAGAVARRAGSGLLKPAEWLAWMRVLKAFLHASACPDVLLYAGCALVACVAVICWSVGVVWVSRHEQGVSLCRGALRWCVAVCAAVHAGAVARRAGSGLPKWAGACMKTNLLLGF